MSTRTVHDPFHGKDVQISNRLVDRLRGKYANGPHLPNGNPEFGWRQFQSPPIQHEAADCIDALEGELSVARLQIALIADEVIDPGMDDAAMRRAIDNIRYIINPAM